MLLPSVFARIWGMMARWTAVGRANPSLRHVDTRGGHRPRSAKVVVREFDVVVVAGSDDDDDDDDCDGTATGGAARSELVGS